LALALTLFSPLALLSLALYYIQWGILKLPIHAGGNLSLNVTRCIKGIMPKKIWGVMKGRGGVFPLNTGLMVSIRTGIVLFVGL
jgi:hypothetical protein